MKTCELPSKSSELLEDCFGGISPNKGGAVSMCVGRVVRTHTFLATLGRALNLAIARHAISTVEHQYAHQQHNRTRKR